MDELERIKKNPAPFSRFNLELGDKHQRCPMPDHQDRNPSCSVFRGNENGYVRFKCHGCGETGTIVDLYAKTHHLDDKEAVQKVIEEFSAKDPSMQDVETSTVDKKYPEYTTWEPPELQNITYEDGPTRPGMGIRDGDSWSTLFFTDATSIDVQPCEYEHGKRAFAVIRWDDVKLANRDDENKVIRQCFYDGDKWRPKITEDGLIRPLHNYTDLAMAQEDPELFGPEYVLVVEGEKCIHRLERAQEEANDSGIPWFIPTSPIGGSNAFDKNDWSVLEGLDVIILPDHDAPGYTLAHNIGRALEDSEGDVEVIKLYKDKEENRGDDVVDWLEEPDHNIYELFELERESPIQTEEEEEEEEDKPPEDIVLQNAMHASGRHDIRDIIGTLVKHHYDPVFETEVLNALKESTGQTKTSLKNLMKAYKEKHEGDYFHKLAKSVKDNFYDGNIIMGESIFWKYTGTHWKELKHKEVKGAIQSEHQKKEAPPCDIVTAQEKTFKIIGPHLVLEKDQDMKGLTEPPPPVINTQNTEIHVDTRTGELTTRNHDPEHFLTHCLDVEYDPDAEAPEYEGALEKIFCGDEELIRHWHEVVGYLIQPKRDIKQFFIFQGPGNNGKSKLIRLVGEHLCGYENVAWREIEDLDSQFQRSSLIGKIMYVDDDVQKNTHLPDGILKKISEEKPITVEKKYEDPFEIVSYAVPVLCTNHTLHTSDLTSAMRSRTHLIPFDARFVNPDQPDTPDLDPDNHIYKQDPHIFTRIQENETEGVLRLAVEGLQRLRSRGRFDMPDKCRTRKRSWLAESNSFSFFVDKYIITVDDSEERSYIYRDEIFDAYEKWAHDANVQYQIEKRNLKSKLEDLGYREKINTKCDNTEGWKLEAHKINQEALP